MNLTIEQLQVLSARLPPGYLLEPTKPVLRESSLVSSQSLPDFPLSTGKKAVSPQFFNTSGGRPSRSQITEGFCQLFTILAKLKKHPGSVYFQGSEKEGRDNQEINLVVVEGRLFREEYETGWQFVADLRRMCAEGVAKCTGDSQTVNAVAVFRNYFEGLMKNYENIVLTLRKLQKVNREEGPNPAFPEERRKLLILKIRLLEEKYIRGIAETLQATETEQFLDSLEERLGTLQPAALKGLAQHVEACLAKSRSLPWSQFVPAETQQEERLKTVQGLL